jgi:hypothetical protein
MRIIPIDVIKSTRKRARIIYYIGRKNNNKKMLDFSYILFQHVDSMIQTNRWLTKKYENAGNGAPTT